MHLSNKCICIMNTLYVHVYMYVYIYIYIYTIVLLSLILCLLFSLSFSAFHCLHAHVTNWPTGQYPQINDDLVNSHHLLLCCMDMLFCAATEGKRKDLLNPNCPFLSDSSCAAAGSGSIIASEEKMCILTELCTKYGGGLSWSASSTCTCYTCMCLGVSSVGCFGVYTNRMAAYYTNLICCKLNTLVLYVQCELCSHCDYYTYITGVAVVVHVADLHMCIRRVCTWRDLSWGKSLDPQSCDTNCSPNYCVYTVHCINKNAYTHMYTPNMCYMQHTHSHTQHTHTAIEKECRVIRDFFWRGSIKKMFERKVCTWFIL